MADNIPLNAVSVPGGKTLRTKDFGGLQHELIVNEYLDSGGNPVEVTELTPLPVKDEVAEQALTDIAAGTAASLGQKVMGASVPVVIASDQTAIPVTGSFTPSGTQDTNEIQLAGTAIDVNSGNKSAGTQRIVIATDQPQLTNALKVDGSGVTQPISAAALPLPLGAAISANQQTDALTNTQLRLTPVPVSGTVSTGGLTDVQLRATPVPVSGTVTVDTSALLTTADFDTKTGSLTETAPATDTASSGLNGRLQRIAQRITSLITALGSPFQAGGSIGNTSFAATQATAANLNMTEASAAAILAKVTAAAASFVKLEDVASVDGDAGVPALAVRKATPANTSGSDGDYEFLQMSAGKLWVQAGATQKPSYGATVVMTVTNLQSLASSATSGWQSARVSNVPTTLANDYEIFVKLTTANTAPASDKAMYVYACPFYTSDAGVSTWLASSQGTTTLPTGTEGTTVIASPNNLRLLGVLNYTTAQMVVQDTFLLSNCFGNRLSDGFSIIIINFSGATLSTGCIVQYSPINDILV